MGRLSLRQGRNSSKGQHCRLQTTALTWTTRQCEVSWPAAGASCSCCLAAPVFASTPFASWMICRRLTVATAELHACTVGGVLQATSSRPPIHLRRAGRPAADAQGRCNAPTATLLVGWRAPTSARVPLATMLRLQGAKQRALSPGAV